MYVERASRCNVRMVPIFKSRPVGIIPLMCRGLRAAMGADAKQSGSCDTRVICQGQLQT